MGCPMSDDLIEGTAEFDDVRALVFEGWIKYDARDPKGTAFVTFGPSRPNDYDGQPDTMRTRRIVVRLPL